VWNCRRRARRAGGSERQLAVKLMKWENIPSADRANMENEVNLHAGVKHPHIVDLIVAFDDGHVVSLVMELCLGGDLFDLVARRRMRAHPNPPGLPEKDAAIVLQHTLKAIEYLHSQRIVHNDVKCENVLLHERDLPVERTTFKLCDFGFAARVPVGGALTARVGSPSSVAPEILHNKPYSTLADMWSVGVLLYVILVAMPPFAAGSRAQVMERVKAGMYSLSGIVWKKVSIDAKLLVRAMMSFNPRDRVTASAALQDVWFQQVHRRFETHKEDVKTISREDALYVAESNRLNRGPPQHMKSRWRTSPSVEYYRPNQHQSSYYATRRPSKGSSQTGSGLRRWQQNRGMLAYFPPGLVRCVAQCCG